MNINIESMKRLQLLVLIIFFSPLGGACQGQDIVNKRIDLVWGLVRDLRSDIPFSRIYSAYLEEGDVFSSAARRKVGDDWSEELRAALNRVSLKEVEVYQYINHPDSALIKRSVNESPEEYPEYRPLRFLLNVDNEHSNLFVNLDDVYVVRLKSNGPLTYVLFNEHDKMITYGALQILNTIWLGKF